MALPVILPFVGAKIVAVVLPFLGALFAVAFFKAALKFLAIFGIGSLTVTGFGGFFTVIENLLIEQVSGMPLNMVEIMYLAKVDKAMTIIISAQIVGLTLRGVDSLTRPIMVNAN